MTAGPAPTEDKPQSTLWWNDGAWWALMRVPAGVTPVRLILRQDGQQTASFDLSD